MYIVDVMILEIVGTNWAPYYVITYFNFYESAHSKVHLAPRTIYKTSPIPIAGLQIWKVPFHLHMKAMKIPNDVIKWL